MRIPIHIYPFGAVVPKYIGYIETDAFNAEKCFELCNWIHWTNEKPKELHSDIESACHGICFTNPETREKWLAKSSGWLVGNIIDISEYVKTNKDKILWI